MQRQARAPMTAPIGKSPRQEERLVAVAGLLALSVALGIGRFAFTPILPMMQADAGVTIAAGAWIASANYVGYFLGALLMMFVRLSAPMAIRTGLVTIAATTLVMGLAGEFATWMLLRAIAGLASAWVLINVSAWCLQRLASARRPLLTGVVFAGVGSGIAVVGALCVLLMHAHATSAQAWVVSGVLALAVAASTWLVFQDEDRAGASRARRPQPRARLTWDGEWVRLVVCYGALGVGYIIPATFLPVMAKEKIADPTIFGWAWPLFGMASAISSVAVAILPRTTNRGVWSGSQLVMALGIVLTVLWPSIVAIMIAALCVGGTFMVITMVGMQEARDVAGSAATSLMAAMTSAFAIGQIAGPLLVRSFLDHSGGLSSALLIAVAPLCVSAGVLAAPRWRTVPRPRTADDRTDSS
jgi:predicted MFS family arabinose efflux permease